MIADDVVETIGALAEEFGDSDVGEILVGLGMAPDELARFTMVAKWSVERVERSLALMALDGLLRDDPAMVAAMLQSPIAAWLDGFAVGVSVARSDADRRAS